MNLKTLFLLLLIIPFSSSAQYKRHFIIKTAASNYTAGGINIAFEIQQKEKESINISLEKGNWINGTTNKGWDKFNAIVLEKREYFKPKEGFPSGIFICPYLKYRFKDKNQLASNGFFGLGALEEDIFKSHSIGAGFGVGYQRNFYDYLTMEIKAGPGFLLNIKTEGKTPQDVILPNGILAFSFGLRL